MRRENSVSGLAGWMTSFCEQIDTVIVLQNKEQSFTCRDQ